MNQQRRNNLLRIMADAEFRLLEPHLTLVDITKGDELALPESPIRHVWFPMAGIISVVATTASGTQAEVGIVGREGMISVATLHGVDVEMMHIFCQMPGQALRLPAAVLRGAMAASPTLRQNLLSYAHNFLLQVASSALAYATQTIEARLARWLMMSLVRLDGADVTMTHEAFALMLGVRRAGVTVAIQNLEAKGAITSRRAAVTVVSRDVLAEIAGDSYGTAERDYQKVIGTPLRDAGGKGIAESPAGGVVLTE